MRRRKGSGKRESGTVWRKRWIYINMELTKLEKYESEYFFKFNVKEGSQGEKECHDRPTEVAKFKFNGQKEK